MLNSSQIKVRSSTKGKRQYNCKLTNSNFQDYIIQNKSRQNNQSVNQSRKNVEDSDNPLFIADFDSNKEQKDFYDDSNLFEPWRNNLNLSVRQSQPLHQDQKKILNKDIIQRLPSNIQKSVGRVRRRKVAFLGKSHNDIQSIYQNEQVNTNLTNQTPLTPLSNQLSNITVQHRFKVNAINSQIEVHTQKLKDMKSKKTRVLKGKRLTQQDLSECVRTDNGGSPQINNFRESFNKTQNMIFVERSNNLDNIEFFNNKIMTRPKKSQLAPIATVEYNYSVQKHPTNDTKTSLFKHQQKKKRGDLLLPKSSLNNYPRYCLNQMPQRYQSTPRSPSFQSNPQILDQNQFYTQLQQQAHIQSGKFEIDENISKFNQDLYQDLAYKNNNQTAHTQMTPIGNLVKQQKVIEAYTGFGVTQESSRSPRSPRKHLSKESEDITLSTMILENIRNQSNVQDQRKPIISKQPKIQIKLENVQIKNDKIKLNSNENSLNYNDVPIIRNLDKKHNPTQPKPKFSGSPPRMRKRQQSQPIGEDSQISQVVVKREKKQKFEQLMNNGKLQDQELQRLGLDIKTVKKRENDFNYFIGMPEDSRRLLINKKVSNTSVLSVKPQKGVMFHEQIESPILNE